MKTFKHNVGIRTQGLEQRKALLLYAKEKGVPLIGEEAIMRDIDDPEDAEIYPSIVFRDDLDVFGIDLARETREFDDLTEEEFRSYCDAWAENAPTPAKGRAEEELKEFLGIDTTPFQKELQEEFSNRPEGVTTIEIVKRVESSERLTERAKIYVALWLGQQASKQRNPLESLLAELRG